VADIAGAAYMRAAAKLNREMPRRAGLALPLLTHGDNAHLVTVFFAEERERARRHRLVGRHEARRDGTVLADAGVHLAVDDVEVLGRKRTRMAEVEAEPIGCDQRALLRHMLAQAAAQRLMQEVRHRVVGAKLRAAALVDTELDEVAQLERAMRHLAEMHMKLACFLLRVGDGELAPLRGEGDAGVAHLPTGFGVERRLVDEDRRLLSGARFGNAFAVNDDGGDLAFGDVRLVAQELAGTELVAQLEPELLGRGLARAHPMFPGL